MGKPQSLALALMFALGAAPAAGRRQSAAAGPAVAGPPAAGPPVRTQWSPSHARHAAGASASDACPLLPEFTEGVELDHVKATLRPGGHLNILVIGSGTVLGPEPTTPRLRSPIAWRAR